MKKFISFIIFLIFTPVFILFLVSYSLKFQILDNGFWKQMLNKEDVYLKLEPTIVSLFREQAVEEGATGKELEEILSFITAENLQDITEKNIDNFLDYANGKDNRLLIYVPLSKLPPGILPPNIIFKNEEISYETLSSYFVNPTAPAGSDTDISKIPEVSGWVNYTFNASAILLTVFILLLYVLHEEGKKMLLPGMVLILSSVDTLIIIGFANLGWENISKDWATTEPALTILSIITPPLLAQITKTWGLFSVSFLLLGTVLMFIKKPGRPGADLPTEKR